MKFRDFTPEDIEELKKQLSKTILWVGAGISIDGPTSLPLGSNLTKYYFDQALGQKRADAIVKKWEEIEKVLSCDFKISFPLIRLEFLIGCINYVDCELYRKTPMLYGLKSFDEMSANTNHYVLHYLTTKCGATIVTPNFDCCIENVSTKKEYGMENGVDYVQIENHKVYHYHGLASKPKDMGATIIKIKEGLPIEFAKWLKGKLCQGYNLICVGFSCSDFFDVEPFFDSLQSDKYDGIGVFFGHGKVNNNNYRKINKMLRCFKSKKYLEGETGKFLLRLLPNAGAIKEPKRVGKDWKEEFERVYQSCGKGNTCALKRICDKQDCKLKDYYLIKIVNQIGMEISYDIVQNDPYIFLHKALSDTKEIKDFIGETIRKNCKGDYNRSVFSDLRELCFRNKNIRINKDTKYLLINLKRIIKKQDKQTKKLIELLE